MFIVPQFSTNQLESLQHQYCWLRTLSRIRAVSIVLRPTQSFLGRCRDTSRIRSGSGVSRRLVWSVCQCSRSTPFQMDRRASSASDWQWRLHILRVSVHWSCRRSIWPAASLFQDLPRKSPHRMLSCKTWVGPVYRQWRTRCLCRCPCAAGFAAWPGFHTVHTVLSSFVPIEVFQSGRSSNRNRAPWHHRSGQSWYP